MVIKIPITQIPQLWELIKFVGVKTDNINEAEMQGYCNKLLLKLLTNQLHVIVRLDENKLINAMMIIEFTVSELNKKKTVHLRNFYSWKSASVEEWQSAYPILDVFAKEEKCDFIEALSYNPRVWELAEAVGFKEVGRQYILTL